MKPLVIGIAGGTASGKTTVARKIANRIGGENVIMLEHDSYYKDITWFGDRKVDEINFDHPDALDTKLLIEHVRKLRRYESVEVPVYDFTTYRRLSETRHVEPRDVIIIEGILIFVEKELRELMDIKIFVDTDADERFIRRIKRDIIERGRTLESVINQYIRTVKPMHLEFVEPSKRWADIIIPRGGENEVAIEMIASRIKVMLDSKNEM
jgi:uridine kinase